MTEETQVVKLCECGCGNPAPIAKWTNTKRGHIKGQQIRFLTHHHLRVKNPNSKGCIIVHHGYIFVRTRKNKYELLHRGIVENAIGKNLPEKSVVHHHSKTQLVACEDNSYHMFLHKRTRAYRACGHAHWRKCKFCKEHDDPNNLYIAKTNAHHRSCAAEYARGRRV